jgi:hypothetical protein
MVMPLSAEWGGAGLSVICSHPRCGMSMRACGKDEELLVRIDNNPEDGADLDGLEFQRWPAARCKAAASRAVSRRRRIS